MSEEDYYFISIYQMHVPWDSFLRIQIFFLSLKNPWAHLLGCGVCLWSLLSFVGFPWYHSLNTAEKHPCFWIKDSIFLKIDTLASGRKETPKYSRFSSAVSSKIKQDKIYEQLSEIIVAINQCFGIQNVDWYKRVQWDVLLQLILPSTHTLLPLENPGDIVLSPYTSFPC